MPDIFELLEQPDFWNEFTNGIICPYCGDRLDVHNGTIRQLPPEQQLTVQAIYHDTMQHKHPYDVPVELLCVRCHLENRT